MQNYTNKNKKFEARYPEYVRFVDEHDKLNQELIDILIFQIIMLMN